MVTPHRIYTLRPLDAVLVAALQYAHCRRQTDQARYMNGRDVERAFDSLFEWESALCRAVDRLPVSELTDDVIANAPDQDGAN